MGFLLTTLCAGLAIASHIKDKIDAEEDELRDSIECEFEEGISKEEFYEIVKCSGKGIKRITNLYARGAIVYGTVRSQSGISEWHFKVSFNDYGELSGRYWVSSDNEDSDIPKVIATRISQQIHCIKK